MAVWVCEKLEPNPEPSLECALMRTALEHLQQMARFPLMLNVASKRRKFQNAAAAKLALAMDSVLPGLCARRLKRAGKTHFPSAPAEITRLTPWGNR
jgi:hypothetical protein